MGLVFDWETKGFWTCFLHRRCSYICKLDVRLSNQPIWTSTVQVMVHFSGLPQLRLFICLCPNFGTDFGADFVLLSRLIWDRPMVSLVVRFGAVMAHFEIFLWLVLWLMCNPVLLAV